MRLPLSCLLASFDGLVAADHDRLTAMRYDGCVWLLDGWTFETVPAILSVLPYALGAGNCGK
jgi:hypothetical protein